MMVRIIGLIILILATSALPSFSTTYRIKDLGTFGGTWACANGINACGQVVGAYMVGGAKRAFLYTPGTGFSDIGDLPGYKRSVARGINSSGEIVGVSYGDDSLDHRAFLYRPGKGMTDLTPAGAIGSTAFAVNSLGQVAGTASLGEWSSYPFLYTPGHGTSALDGSGGLNGAYGMNDMGQVVGTVSVNRSNQGVFYTPGKDRTLMGSLGGSSSAYSVNCDGWVVGMSRLSPTNTAAYRAFLYAPETGMMSLGTLGGTTSEARGINSGGLLVGYSSTGVINRAFAYTRAGGMVDIGSLSPEMQAGAVAVNDAGYIAGMSGTHAVIWEPVPEPSSLLALGAGLLSVVRLIRRRR